MTNLLNDVRGCLIVAGCVVCCLTLMIFFIKNEFQKKYIAAVILKGLASLCFVLLGYFAAREKTQFSNLVFIGLVLGMIADIMLNLRFVFTKKGMLVFLIGILIFLSGHIMYLTALLPMCPNTLLALIIGAVLTALILIWIFKQIEAKMAFKIFGVFYIGAIVIMNVVACSVLISQFSTANLIYVIGAISFLVSDIVLILNTFGKESKPALRVTNLSLYYLGQLLIAISLIFR